MGQRLTRDFFLKKSTIELGRDLLGKILVHQTEEALYSGIIVETESYLGERDMAAHSFNKRRTKRTEIMFGEPGSIYMYQMHQQVLLNFITMPIGVPEAVLIRAIEPISEIPRMVQNRKGKGGVTLTNGPGKLTQALQLTMADYGKTLFSSNIWLEEGKHPYKIEATPRIGIPNKKMATHYPLRFIVVGNPCLSGKKGPVYRDHGFLQTPEENGSDTKSNPSLLGAPL